MSFREDLVIDVNNLDTELLMQPQLYAKYGEELAKTKTKMDKLKDKLELVRAELDTDIRKDPTLYGLEKGKKPTEAQIQSLILQQPEYKRALDRYYKVKEKYETLKVAVTAMEQRKSALENIVRLIALQYFSGPVGVHDFSALQKNYEEKVREEIKNAVVSALNNNEEKVEESTDES